MKTLLKIWSQRHLSLKGQVAVLRSFIMPQILHVASALYTPEWVLSEVDKMFFNFLWSNKKPHVKKEVVINEIANGGLKMPLFSSMVKSMKVTWIKRILSDKYTRLNLLKNFVQYKGESIRKVIKYKLDIEKIKFNSDFYKQVFEYWYEIYSIEPKTTTEILQMELWHNKRILVANTPIFYSTWSRNGIDTIGDIVDENGSIMTKENIELLYHTHVKQMEYNSLIHCIPKQWMNVLRSRTNIKQKVCYDKELIYVLINGRKRNVMDLYCKDIYWIFIKKIAELPAAEEKWSKYINTDYIVWQDHYCIPYNVCQETALQSFQYKVFQRFYPCNYTLSVWYKDHNSECTICKNGVDYLEHFFYYCKETEKFWKSLQQWWHNTIETTIVLDPMSVLFGISNPDNDNTLHFINYCILYGKWYLHECKTQNKEIFLLTFIKKLKGYLEVLKTLCDIKNDTFFQNTYSKYSDMF